MTIDQFEKLVASAVEQLPQRNKDKIKNVAFLVEDSVRTRKSRELGIMMGQTLLGLYEGIPRTKRGEGYFGVLPDRITIFKDPIERICGEDAEKIRKLIYEVVWHEVGHYFGFNEREIRKLEKEKFYSNKFHHE